MMKNKFYVGILSTLFSACAAPQTTFVDYPVIVDGIKSVYSEDSNGDCDLKIPQEDGKQLYLHNKNCDETVDSIALSFQEHAFFYHDRNELNAKSREDLDAQFQKARDYKNRKTYTKCGYNDIPF